MLVIGGGPSGLFTSSLLAEKGYSVALFDKESAIGERVVCSGVVSREAFERYNLPVNSIVGKLREALLHAPSDESIKYVHPEDDVVVVDRKLFDSNIGRIASEKGVSIFNNSVVMSIKNHDDHISANVRHPGGTLSVKAEIAVIATGVSFNLQESLGLGRPKNIIKGIQTEFSSPDIKELNMFWGNNFSKGFFGWAIPLLNGNLKIGVMTKKDPLECFRYTLSKLGKDSLLNSDQIEFKRRGIAFGAIDKSYTDRVVAVGEAAGLVKTTTGGGIYYGLISGEIASGVISDAFRKGRFDARFLSQYQKLINTSISREIKFGEFFHRFYSKLDDQQINRLFDAAKEDRILDFISQRGKFDWHKDTVIRIFRSPNLRNILAKEILQQSKNRFAINF